MLAAVVTNWTFNTEVYFHTENLFKFERVNMKRPDQPPSINPPRCQLQLSGWPNINATLWRHSVAFRVSVLEQNLRLHCRAYFISVCPRLNLSAFVIWLFFVFIFCCRNFSCVRDSLEATEVVSNRVWKISHLSRFKFYYSKHATVISFEDWYIYL